MIEYFAANLWQLWALMAFLCMILELTSGDFYVMCFAIGGAAAAIASALGLGFYPGVFVFVVVSVLCIFFVRPFALKMMHKNVEDRPCNADALLGRKGKVSEAIEAGGYGRVAIDGDDWKAESHDGSAVARGEMVEVVGRESIILSVKKV